METGNKCCSAKNDHAAERTLRFLKVSKRINILTYKSLTEWNC